MPESTESKLLDQAIRAVYSGNKLVSVARANAQHVDEPWVVDDLMVKGYVAQEAQYLVPTIAGLRHADTEEARAILDSLRRLQEELRKSYRNDPKRRAFSAEDVAAMLSIDTGTAGRFLAVFCANWRRSWTSAEGDPASGANTSITLDAGILTDDPLAPPEPPVPSSAPLPLTITVRDFRVLSRVAWRPQGVCLLAGPNGAGKSTLLRAIQFMKDAYERRIAEAIGFAGGLPFLRIGAAPPQVEFGLGVGEVQWTLTLPTTGASREDYPGEQVTAGGKVRLRRTISSPSWYLDGRKMQQETADRTCLRLAVDAQPSLFAPLVALLRSYVLYGSYALDVLRNGGSGSPGDRHLAGNGENLFHVLRTWHGAPRDFRDQFAWVESKLKLAFPGMLEAIEFHPAIGKVVPTRFFPPGSREAILMSFAPDGLLAGMLHLTAVAGASDGGLIAIDEIENHLHPHAIRSILAAIRELAAERHLTVLLTTHSPVVMNEFRDHTDQFFIIEPDQGVQPVALDELKDADWLAVSSLGDLYEREEIGAPPAGDA